MDRRDTDASTAAERLRSWWRPVLLVTVLVWFAASLDEPGPDPFTLSAAAPLR